VRTRGVVRLLLSSLEDAIRAVVVHRYGSRHAKLQREDLDWLMSDDMSDPFTYLRICDALAIDGGWLRRRIFEARAAAEEAPRLVVLAVDDEEGDAALRPRGGGA